MIVLGILGFMILFSFIVGLKDAVSWRVTCGINKFSSPYYTLGCMYREWVGKNEEDQDVRLDSFIIGLIFMEIEFYFYKD